MTNINLGWAKKLWNQQIFWTSHVNCNQLRLQIKLFINFLLLGFPEHTSQVLSIRWNLCGQRKHNTTKWTRKHTAGWGMMKLIFFLKLLIWWLLKAKLGIVLLQVCGRLLILPDNELQTCRLFFITGSGISQMSSLLQAVSGIQPSQDKAVSHFQQCKDRSGVFTLRVKTTEKLFVVCLFFIVVALIIEKCT